MKKAMRITSLSLAACLLASCGVSKFESAGVKQGEANQESYESKVSQDQKPQYVDSSDNTTLERKPAPKVEIVNPPVDKEPEAAADKDESASLSGQKPDDQAPIDLPEPTPDPPVVVQDDPVPPAEEPEAPQLPEEQPVNIVAPERPGDVTGGNVTYRPPNDEDNHAIANCSAAFGRSLPLGANGNVRTIAANISILGGQGLRDNRSTEFPELTIIYANIGILSNLRWDLMNPNGVYCIVANINILSKLSIYLEERAQLSDGAVAINILSSSNASTATVGINILSNVKVYRTRRD